MSGIYIPGMEMPDGGYRTVEIAFDADGHPMALADGGDVFDVIPVPPHGRLGDLGELEFAFNESAEGLHGTPKWAEIYRECAKAVREAETIIPADPADKDGT